jgi:pimeloyl-ACP methyl ester carboxylesterase
MYNSTADANCNIHYLDLGEASGKAAAILFLHGWGLEGQTFLPSLRLLAQDRRVIAPDLPGFGRTKCAIDEWDYDRLATSMVRLILDLGLQRVHLIGHSLGAATCIKICTLLPENVLSLILVDSAGIPFGSYRNLVFRRLLGLSEQFIVQFILSPRYSLLYFRAFAYNLIFNLTSSFNAVDMPLYGDLRQTARQVKHRTLIVWGEKDRTTPVEMGHALSQQLQNSRLEVVHGNYYHEWSILYPREFAKIARDFINQIEQ